MMSSEDWKAIVDEASRLARGNLVFEGEFVNFTPWWGGNFRTETLSFISDAEARVTVPDAKTIAGKTAWFMRTVFGDQVLEDLGIIDENREGRGEREKR
ncbi:hypothetical protein [Acidilobus sp.]|uniref:hypothetical protein n=1 Tax=Acidilobus sp. TaxID=1872109 RepID=UPI003CFC5537